MISTRILEVAELDFRIDDYDWDFARERAAEIRAHWEKRLAAQPSLFNGRVLLMREHEFVERPEGGLKLRGTYFETDFAHFLGWRDLGFPSHVCNGFSMAALKSSDGAFLLGEMGPHTANAGKIYFAAGTPDRSDVFGDIVDLTASVTRELGEETGVSASETTYDSSWIVVHAPPRVACMKIMRLGVDAETAKARIESFLAREEKPELARMHIVRGLADIQPARMPPFVREFLEHALG